MNGRLHIALTAPRSPSEPGSVALRTVTEAQRSASGRVAACGGRARFGGMAPCARKSSDHNDFYGLGGRP